MTIYDLISKINSGGLDETFAKLYGPDSQTILKQRIRYLSAAENFSKLYPESNDVQIFSAPGRTEIGGNHTDHQNGCVLAAAINLDIIAVVAFNEEEIIRFSSAECRNLSFRADKLMSRKYKPGTARSLVHGVCARAHVEGAEVIGMNIYADSVLPSGSGLSSSAALEMLIVSIINSRFDNNDSYNELLAKIGQAAEQYYFGKECGLMDQLVILTGGAVFIDFISSYDIPMEKIEFDLSRAGYSICITDTRSSHADLTDEYSSVAKEMQHVAAELKGKVLRDVSEEEFYKKLPKLRKKCTDRELLRAMHFFSENERAVLEAQALRNGNTEEFFELVNASGDSSAQLLQNLYPADSPDKQPLTLAIALSRRILGGSGAVRVHGGGFAGTIQAFVPAYMVSEYISGMEKVFGKGSCHVVNVRSEGCVQVIV